MVSPDRARGDGAARHPYAGGPVFDLHQGNLRVDDGCLPVGTALLAQTAWSRLRG